MSRPRRVPSTGLVAAMVSALLTCDVPTSVVEPDVVASTGVVRVPRAELASVRAWEEAQRLVLDFREVPPWDERSGIDPFAVLRLDSTRWVGVERGNDAIVVLDAGGRVLQREVAPARPTGLAIGEGVVWVVGEGEGSIGHVRIDSTSDRPLVPSGVLRLDGSFALRDVAIAPRGWLYFADRHRGRIRGARITGEMPRLAELASDVDCPGVSRVLVVGHWLFGNCMLDHRVVGLRLRADGTVADEAPVSIRHDGPIWALDAVVDDAGVSLAVAGVEDHPLDRSDGAFGYVDSRVFTYRIEHGPSASTVQRLAEIDVAAHGVITPKALHLQATGVGHTLTVSGYGGDQMVEIDLDATLRPTGAVRSRARPPGITSFAGDLDAGVAADPLLDAWITWDASGVQVVQVSDPTDARTVAERIGEALVFTHLMAPWNESTGRKSRFTCETCHFEGTVDGRTHWTGRDDVHATTKTLQGLFENRPHFSRALDRTTTNMVHSEFRVANRASDRDPWFSVPLEEVPWVRWLGAGPDDLDPLALRRALVSFLLAYRPEANPTTVGRERFDALEARGARLFSEHCERCHQARLVTDQPASRVPFEQWEALVFGGGPIVWADEVRRQTGVQPYVHPQGARTPSLRRLWVKRPYFTNGSAHDLAAVLEGVIVREPFAHAGPPLQDGQRRLDADERAALAAFLDLL